MPTTSPGETESRFNCSSVSSTTCGSPNCRGVAAARTYSQRGVNAREEKIAARKKKDLTTDEPRHHAEMEKLYRKEVLKEQPGVPVLQIQGLKKAPPQPQTTH